MAIIEQITCDVCGKQKQAVNHWWVGTITDIGPHKSFTIYPWPTGHKEIAQGKKVNHLCGQDCVTKALNKWMQEQTQRKES